MQTFLKECRWGRFLLLRGDMISRFVDLYGEWAEVEVDLFRTLLPEDGVCVEVGSNIGMHAIPLSKICERGRIFCYEPQRPIFNILCGNIALNNRLNVVARNQAVGETNGCVTIQTGDYEENWNYGAFSIDRGFNAEGAFGGAVTTEPVDVVALDADPLVAKLERLDLIKIDAEGFEPHVLAGARNLIARLRPYIFVEANVESAVVRVMEELRPQKYNAFWFVGRRYRADNFNRSKLAVDGWDVNMIFRPEERAPLPGALKPVQQFGDLAEGVPILDKFP